jgi:hypothetical protein
MSPPHTHTHTNTNTHTFWRLFLYILSLDNTLPKSCSDVVISKLGELYAHLWQQAYRPKHDGAETVGSILPNKAVSYYNYSQSCSWHHAAWISLITLHAPTLGGVLRICLDPRYVLKVKDPPPSSSVPPSGCLCWGWGVDLSVHVCEGWGDPWDPWVLVFLGKRCMHYSGNLNGYLLFACISTSAMDVWCDPLIAWRRNSRSSIDVTSSRAIGS